MHSQHHTPDLPHRDQHATQAQEPDISAYNTGKLRAVARKLVAELDEMLKPKLRATIAWLLAGGRKFVG